MSLFLFIPYFIGAILSKNYCQKWEFGNKKKWRRGGGRGEVVHRMGVHTFLHTMLMVQKMKQSIFVYSLMENSKFNIQNYKNKVLTSQKSLFIFSASLKMKKSKTTLQVGS